MTEPIFVKSENGDVVLYLARTGSCPIAVYAPIEEATTACECGEPGAYRHVDANIARCVACYELLHPEYREDYEALRAPQSPAGSGDLAAPGESATLAEEDVP